MEQIEKGYTSLLERKPSTIAISETNPQVESRILPRLLTLGGDHTILLPILRSLNEVYGPVSVIHFDSRLNSWNPADGGASKEAIVTHGSFFYLANKESLLPNDTNIHTGLRTTLGNLADYDDDDKCGFFRLEAREIDVLGVQGIIERIKSRVGTQHPAYISIDIDTPDPAFAPATGTPETGGWTTRGMRAILREISDPIS